MTTSAFIVRPFSVDDTEEVIQLWRDVGLVAPHNDPYRDIQRKLARSSGAELFLIAETKGADQEARIVGTAMGGYEGHRGWVNYLGVAPHEQRLGIGQRLMAELEALLTELGCPKINLQVRSTNQAVIDFYSAIGYKQDDVISMGKRLVTDTST